MKEPDSTRAIRKILEGFGAVKPGRRAVAMVAIEVSAQGARSLWHLKYPMETIGTAVVACKGLRGEASYKAFEEALRMPSK